MSSISSAQKIIFILILLSILIAGCKIKNNNLNSSVNEEEVLSVDRIYNLDPQRKFIGKDVGDQHFINLVSGSQVHFDELYRNKVILIQTFSNGCPASVEVCYFVATTKGTFYILLNISSQNIV